MELPVGRDGSPCGTPMDHMMSWDVEMPEAMTAIFHFLLPNLLIDLLAPFGRYLPYLQELRPLSDASFINRNA
jgi:hypothetical protein